MPIVADFENEEIFDEFERFYDMVNTVFVQLMPLFNRLKPSNQRLIIRSLRRRADAWLNNQDRLMLRRTDSNTMI